jgi:ABC-type Fe3+/spermidine/putrescine transport system ATPase subunit
VSLEIKTGEFVTLLGPSGCGKTTFLRLVAGLERPTNGRIYLEGECINDIPPYRCEMGLVVQNYALFPHMTVFDNVAYGLKVRRLNAEEINAG